MANGIRLDAQELATVLAALRFWQREGLLSGGHEVDIATDGGTLEPLGAEAIDQLCERINTAGVARFRIWCRVSGGVTGTRQAWLKSNGGIVEFVTRADAEAHAAELNREKANHPNADFRYSVREASDAF